MKNYKKQIILLLGMTVFAVQQMFAVKLPEGTNVRTSNIVQDGDAIVMAELSQPATINTPIGQLEVAGNVYFYKSGALKLCCLNDENESLKLQTEIGEMNIYTSYRDDDGIEFYESGAVKKVELSGYEANNKSYLNKLKTGLGEIYVQPGIITFYDSGSPEKFQLRTFDIYSRGNSDIQEQNKNLTYTCELGTFKLNDGETSSWDDKYPADFSFDYNYSSPCMQYPSGKMKTFVPSDPYDIKTPLGDTFGKEKKPISLREDGSLISYYTDDVIQTNIAGIDVNIPAGKYLSFYPNGNVCYFVSSGEQTIKIGGQEHKFGKNALFRASEDGKSIIEAPQYKYLRKDGVSYSSDTDYPDSPRNLVKKIYDNGIPKKRDGRNGFVWTDDALKYEVKAIYPGEVSYGPLKVVTAVGMPKYLDQEIFGGGELYLQPEDANRNVLEKYKNRVVGMVFFGSDGKPSSYSAYKFNDFGEYETDDVDCAILETTKKKFLTKKPN